MHISHFLSQVYIKKYRGKIKERVNVNNTYCFHEKLKLILKTTILSLLMQINGVNCSCQALKLMNHFKITLAFKRRSYLLQPLKRKMMEQSYRKPREVWCWVGRLEVWWISILNVGINEEEWQKIQTFKKCFCGICQ